jgi:hypothetical protein
MNLVRLGQNYLGEDFFRNKSVLDVGARDFGYSRLMVSLGAEVYAIDRVSKFPVVDDISFEQCDLLDWNTDHQIDVLFMSNVAQFIQPEKLLPKISEIAAQYIMIRTFSDFPEPNWEAPQLRPMYFIQVDKWREFLEAQGYIVHECRAYEEQSEDLQGDIRSFRYIDIIAEKK